MNSLWLNKKNWYGFFDWLLVAFSAFLAGQVSMVQEIGFNTGTALFVIFTGFSALQMQLIRKQYEQEQANR